MSTGFERAVDTLYQASLGAFVETRRRLVVELKAAGDAAGAAKLAKCKRPTRAAWVVNQLWWRERDSFAALFESARRLQQGELTGSAEHREIERELRRAASVLLSELGTSGMEANLRRVMGTLSALAISGFAPDRAGVLSTEREASGFQGALHLDSALLPGSAQGLELASTPEDPAAKAALAAEARAAEQAAAARLAERQAELERVRARLELARQELEASQSSIQRLQAELRQHEQRAALAEARVSELDAELARLA